MFVGTLQMLTVGRRNTREMLCTAVMTLLVAQLGVSITNEGARIAVYASTTLPGETEPRSVAVP